jgi:hypothetical protein
MCHIEQFLLEPGMDLLGFTIQANRETAAPIYHSKRRWVGNPDTDLKIFRTGRYQVVPNASGEPFISST